MSLLHRVLLIALLCLPTVASAQSSKTKEVAIPMGHMLDLLQAIAALDGPERIIKDGANERVAKDTTLYKFAPGFKTAMSRNLTALKSIVEGYNAELGALRAAAGGELKDGSPAVIRLNEENRKLLMVVQKANLFTLQEAELKLDSNQIPVSVLSALEPIIEFPQ